MSKDISIEVRCLHCEKWFKSPIGFGGIKSYDTSILIGNRVNCSKFPFHIPHLSHILEIEYMRF